MAAETSSSNPSSSNLKIIVQNNPSDSQLNELGIKSWPKMFHFQGCSNLLLLFFFFFFLQFSNAEQGTASLYNPPYTPTLCYGNDTWKFSTNNLIAAAGEGIWDDGAACGQRYLVKCISSTVPNTCKLDQSIQVTIVDRAQTSISRPARPGTAIVLSNTAFGTIANPPAIFIVTEIKPV